MSIKISQIFRGVGAKRLSDVEVHKEVSNQHELNGISQFKEIFGTEKLKFNGKFLYLSDKETEQELDINMIESEGSATWYDAREKHPTRTEFRLYYTTNEAIKLAAAGDLLILVVKDNDEVIFIIAEQESTIEKQLMFLFNLEEVEDKFIIRSYEKEDKDLRFADKRILEFIGFEVEETDENFLEEMIRLFNGNFPETKIFSAYARKKVDIDVKDDPDATLVGWYEKEKILFKTLEKHLVSKFIKDGFGKNGDDVDLFIEYSLSVHNRRKSRAGKAFENHLEELFKIFNLKHSRGQITENNSKPDFVFPSIQLYHTEGFNKNVLTMLGVKTTAKDRWRQILPEADLIWPKHLITLEPAISKNQTDEMKSKRVQLVLPKGILPTYSEEQKKDIITLKDFITLIHVRQNSY